MAVSQRDDWRRRLPGPGTISEIPETTTVSPQNRAKSDTLMAHSIEKAAAYPGTIDQLAEQGDTHFGRIIAA